MKSRQGSGPQGGWGRVLLGSTAGLLAAWVGRKLARRPPLGPSPEPSLVLSSEPSSVPSQVLAAFESQEPGAETPGAAEPSWAGAARLRRGPNGREHYEFIGAEPAYSL
ncbi:uncharacterized protein STAUR_1233 [Stigmatella aurantiaca DW4/3-1]|uniref:Uncharacterized protein n=1 Tax=Stigmatella aurantiaca (strain DW4/3-1) TaxID=378806 RepID=E3FHG5_STIAD|nr:uncharacterized protein STAUR_1233 [Stigmatella aurantiaca DW4/3-1]